MKLTKEQKEARKTIWAEWYKKTDTGSYRNRHRQTKG